MSIDPDSIEGFIVKASEADIMRAAAERCAAEVSRGRVPKVGDRMRMRVEPFQTVTEVTPTYVVFGENGKCDRGYAAERFEYEDEVTK